MKRIWAILVVCSLLTIGFFLISSPASAHTGHNPYPSHSKKCSPTPTAVPPSTDNPTPTPTAVPPSTDNPTPTPTVTSPTAVPPSTNNPTPSHSKTTPIIVNPPPTHAVKTPRVVPKPAYSLGTAVATHRVSVQTSPVAQQRQLATTGFKASTWIWLALFLILGGLGLIRAGHKGSHR